MDMEGGQAELGRNEAMGRDSTRMVCVVAIGDMVSVLIVPIL